MDTIWRVRPWRLVLGASMFAAALVAVATWRGPGLSPDSVNYLAAGVNLANGHGLLDLAGREITALAPGLSFVAAAGEWIGLGGQPTLRLLGIACMALVVPLTWYELQTAVRSRALILFGTGLVAATPVLLNVAKMAWTEAPFVLASLAALSLVGRIHAGCRHPVRLAVLAVAACWLCFLLRYAGVTVMAAATIVLALPRTPTRGLWLRLADAALFIFAASAVPLAWMLRNRAVDGTLLGPRPDSPDDLTGSIERILATFGRWIIPLEEMPDRAALILGALSLIVLGSVVIWASPRSLGTGKPGLEADPREMLRLPAVHLVFVPTYVGYLVLAQLATLFDPINVRLSSPIFVPTVVAVLWALDRAPATQGPSVGRVRQIALLAAVGLVALHATLAIGYSLLGARRGIGFNRTQWTESELATAVDSARTEESSPLYSNRPPGLWSATGIQPILQTPLRLGARGSDPGSPMAQLEQDLACADGPVLLATYDSGGLFTVEPGELSSVGEVVLVETTSDGTLHRLSAKQSSEC